MNACSHFKWQYRHSDKFSCQAYSKTFNFCLTRKLTLSQNPSLPKALSQNPEKRNRQRLLSWCRNRDHVCSLSCVSPSLQVHDQVPLAASPALVRLLPPPASLHHLVLLHRHNQRHCRQSPHCCLEWWQNKSMGSGKDTRLFITESRRYQKQSRRYQKHFPHTCKTSQDYSKWKLSMCHTLQWQDILRLQLSFHSHIGVSDSYGAQWLSHRAVPQIKSTSVLQNQAWKGTALYTSVLKRTIY